MKKYKIFFIGKQEHVHEDIAQWGHVLMKEFEAEGFHLETEAIKFLREKISQKIQKITKNKINKNLNKTNDF